MEDTGDRAQSQRTGRTKRTTAKRLTDRDREVWNVFAIAGEAVRGGGGGFQAKPSLPDTDRPLKFLCTVIF